YGLSAREREIAELIFEGRNNKEIAAMLYLSPNTVKVHASNLYRKLGAVNRVQAAAVLRGEDITNSIHTETEEE
ncbi:MAG: helix-turn-helix transcriptional regulator, partial [Firmicutes bacterium]|nr:helix-turn-helix transcriptional regulator [Bacillota bacterium]